MLAFLARRQDTPMPETTTTTETDAPQADDNVLMRFLTQGGAEVHVTNEGVRYGVRCLGCDTSSTSGMTIYARSDANDHATVCRAMPKPTAA